MDRHLKLNDPLFIMLLKNRKADVIFWNASWPLTNDNISFTLIFWKEFVSINRSLVSERDHFDHFDHSAVKKEAEENNIASRNYLDNKVSVEKNRDTTPPPTPHTHTQTHTSLPILISASFHLWWLPLFRCEKCSFYFDKFPFFLCVLRSALFPSDAPFLL